MKVLIPGAVVDAMMLFDGLSEMYPGAVYLGRERRAHAFEFSESQARRFLQDCEERASSDGGWQIGANEKAAYRRTAKRLRAQIEAQSTQGEIA